MLKKKRFISMTFTLLVIVGVIFLYRSTHSPVKEEDKYTHPNGPKDVKRNTVSLLYGEHYCVRGTSKEEEEDIKNFFTTQTGEDVVFLQTGMRTYVNPEWWVDKDFSRVAASNESWETLYEETLKEMSLYSDGLYFLTYHEACSMNYQLQLKSLRTRNIDKSVEPTRWMELIDIVNKFNKENEEYIEFVYITYKLTNSMEVKIEIDMKKFEGDIDEAKQKEKLINKFEELFSLYQH